MQSPLPAVLPSPPALQQSVAEGHQDWEQAQLQSLQETYPAGTNHHWSITLTIPADHRRLVMLSTGSLVQRMSAILYSATNSKTEVNTYANPAQAYLPLQCCLLLCHERPVLLCCMLLLIQFSEPLGVEELEVIQYRHLADPRRTRTITLPCLQSLLGAVAWIQEGQQVPTGSINTPNNA